MTTQTLQNAPDLRKDFPRSPNESLGHYVLLPRIIDKCRAVIAGTNGEYNFNCPLDRQFFDATGIDAETFRAQAEQGKSDEEILAWVRGQSSFKSDEDVMAWSYQQRWRRPTEPQMMFYFEKIRNDVAPNNYRIETWFQLLDADEKRF